MARTCAVQQTAPYRRVERKSDKSKRRNRKRKTHNQNRNKRNRGQRNSSNALKQQVPALRNWNGHNSFVSPKPHSKSSKLSKFVVTTYSSKTQPPLVPNTSEASNQRPPTTSFPSATPQSHHNSNDFSRMNACQSPDLISCILCDTIPTSPELFSLENLSEMSRLQEPVGTTSIFVLPDAVIQFMLAFVPLFDLFGNVRCVSTDFQTMTSVDNPWVVKNLTSQITSEEECEEKTWTCNSNLDSGKKMVLFVAKTYQPGKSLNRLACKTKRRGRTEERLVLRCVISVFGHLSGVVKVVASNKSGWHEIIMSSRLGMNILSSKYLLIYLESKGIEEDKMTEEHREIVRTDYLVYQEQLLHDGVRFIADGAVKYLSTKMDDYDFESAEHMLEHPFPRDEDAVHDRQYPTLAALPSSADLRREMDPLSMLTFMGDGEMARRLARLMMDFENGVPRELIEQCGRALFFYTETLMFNCGSRDDVETAQLIISTLSVVDSGICLFMLGCFMSQNPKEMLVNIARRLIEIQGFDVKFDYDEWVSNRIEFAEEMVPFLLSNIRLEELPPEDVAKLIKFVQSKADPETESVELTTRTQELFLPFVRRFII